MRIRNVKNKEEIINRSKLIVRNPIEYRGKWNTLFNNNNPIYLEIGIGKGKFIIENAKKYTNINFIGIEKEDSIISKALEKEEKLDNLRFILMNAYDIDSIFDKEISRIYLNFSNPWQKKRHEKRRLTANKFLVKYDNIFKDKNEIFLKTDNKAFFAYSIESLNNYGYKFKNITLDLVDSDDNVMTEYEKKFRDKGILINSLEAYKNK